MAEMRMMGAQPLSSGGQERMLDKIFDEVARVRVPAGADHLDLGLDVEQTDGLPAIHLKLSLQAAGGVPAAAALVPEVPPEVVFGPRGHGTIALLAMADLEARRPDIKAKVDAILTADPLGRTEYFGAANWPDHIKGARPETKPWHYIDIIYRPRQPSAKPRLPEPPHALSALAELSAKLRETEDPEEKADTLCFIMHIVGDLHQPLHCATRVTHGFPAPEGDHGGNDFLLGGKKYRKLHALWDDSVNLALEDSAEDLADEIAQRLPRESLAEEIAVRDPEQWARAGFAIAVEKGYRPLEESGDERPEPSGRYLRTARDIGQRQAAIGGYRLADMLTELLGT